MLRKAFCGFAVHAAKSDESLKGLRSSIRQRFLDKLGQRGPGPLAPGPARLFGGEGAALGAAPSPAKRRRPQAVLPVGRGGGGVFRAGAEGPGPKNKPAAGQSPAAGGWAAPTRRRPPRWIFHQRQVERRGKGAPGSFMVRLACVDLTDPVELFQQHHPEELMGKGGGTKGNALIRPAQNGVRKP